MQNIQLHTKDAPSFCSLETNIQKVFSMGILFLSHPCGLSIWFTISPQEVLDMTSQIGKEKKGCNVLR